MSDFGMQDDLCFYCGERTNSLAGNPSSWPLIFCNGDNTGKVKWHHVGCVTERLAGIEKALRWLEKATRGDEGCDWNDVFAARSILRSLAKTSHQEIDNA